MKIKGTITISRITSNDPPESWVQIALEDETSCIKFVEVDISFEQFGQAVSGLSNQNCDIELRGLDLVGKKYEHKFQLVHVPKHLDREDEGALEELWSFYETDGWKAQRKDIFKHHKSRYSNIRTALCYEVSFSRYV